MSGTRTVVRAADAVKRFVKEAQPVASREDKKKTRTYTQRTPYVSIVRRRGHKSELVVRV